MTPTGLSRFVQTVLMTVAMLTGMALVLRGESAPQTTSDQTLRERVEAVLERASDVPADAITVSVTAGVVTLEGSLVCPDCGGMRTPGGTGTVQQSLGAVVRAIPGVTTVVFNLVYDEPT